MRRGPRPWPHRRLTGPQFDYVGGAFYRNIVRLSKHITLNQARAIFGFNESSNIGRIHFGSIQGAPSCVFIILSHG